MGVTQTCIAGSQGCLCDSRGQCAAGLTCTPKSNGQPSLCCNGSNCAGSTSGIGTVCSRGDAAVAACTPGITLPAGSGSNDTCGYPSSGFNENVLLCDMTASGGGAKPAVIEVFYSDEHALTLGCDATGTTVSPSVHAARRRSTQGADSSEGYAVYCAPPGI